MHTINIDRLRNMIEVIKQIHNKKHMYNKHRLTNATRVLSYLAAPHTHNCFKTLWSCHIPSKIVTKLGSIRDSREWVIVINLKM